MNAEVLHDALNLLPADLISAVDKVRSQPRKPKINWGRWASMAACAALILCGGFLAGSRFFSGVDSTAEKMESINEAPPAEGAIAAVDETVCDCMEESVIISDNEEITGSGEILPPTCAEGPAGSYAGSDCFYVGGSAGYTITFGHKEGVEYPQITVIRSLAELEAYYDAYRDDYDMDSLEAGCVHWDDGFFREHDLLLILTEENDGYTCPQVGWLKEQEDGGWALTFSGDFQAGDGTDAVTQWHIYVEIEKDLIGEDDTISVILE